jgi:hypothetical protein
MTRTQTVVTAITCDLCGGEGTEAFTILVDVGLRQLSKPRVIDVCDPCAGPIRTLQLDVRRVGVIMQENLERETLPCPLCGSVKARNNIYAHLRNVHGLTPPKQPKKCPDCGVEANNMVRHRITAHDYDLLADYVAGASSKDKAR